ncbi:MAG: GMC family oxidoreductase, partial [Gammaproteobacteria bacterium]|nr:GMC family oxidoreductase [Gammaproteobacteria bacterium]
MSLTPEACAAIHWDVIVVGTGMGGATVGYDLARRGRKVLFVEKGPFLHAGFAAAPAGLNEQIVRPATAPENALEPEAAERLAGGRWPHRVRARTNLGELNFRVPTGCVTGGSTAHYAAALERFSPQDFMPRSNFPDSDDSTLPEQWPVSYEEFEPHYRAAETLFRVRGTQDPLHSGGDSVLLEPPRLSPRDAHLLQEFAASGLHPYRVHVGCDFVRDCDGCPHGPCERNCKRDAAWTCLIPALIEHGAFVYPDCEVTRINASATVADGIICRQGDTEQVLTSEAVVLAAGAFASPVLLLKSDSPDWPRGIGNQHDLVGRNLMFHGGDFVAIGPDEPLS